MSDRNRSERVCEPVNEIRLKQNCVLKKANRSARISCMEDKYQQHTIPNGIFIKINDGGNAVIMYTFSPLLSVKKLKKLLYSYTHTHISLYSFRRTTV